MPNETGEKFAKLVLMELADIHALLLALHDKTIVDIAEKTGVPIETVRNEMEKKRHGRSRVILNDLASQLNLPSSEAQ
jgi:hypothetical protein